MNPTETPEPIDCESLTPTGQMAYVSLNHMTLSEAIRFAFVPRIAQAGDNVSPPMTLAHAGEVMRVLGDDDEVVRLSVGGGIDHSRIEPMGERRTGREATLVHKR